MCTDTTIEFGSLASLSMSSMLIMSTLLYTYRHFTYLRVKSRTRQGENAPSKASEGAAGFHRSMATRPSWQVLPAKTFLVCPGRMYPCVRTRESCGRSATLKCRNKSSS